MSPLKVGFVPEHFSTPLHFAQVKNFFADANLQIELIPYLAGSGHLIQSLGDKSIDVAIGLTEAFVRGIANGNETYNIVGTYVDSPLNWSVSTGYKRKDITSIADLQSKRLAVSRIGSGSYVMSYVLGLEKKFTNPYFQSHPTLSTFENLRDSVNEKPGVEASDGFMWEYFTTKKYYDSKEIKAIGQIYTPWPSWVICSRSDLAKSEEIARFLTAVSQGIEYFNQHQDEAIEYIYTNLDYTKADAAEWIKTVRFANKVNSINHETVIKNTIRVLDTAGVLNEGDSKDLIDLRLAKQVA